MTRISRLIRYPDPVRGGGSAPVPRSPEQAMRSRGRSRSIRAPSVLRWTAHPKRAQTIGTPIPRRIPAHPRRRTEGRDRSRARTRRPRGLTSGRSRGGRPTPAHAGAADPRRESVSNRWPAPRMRGARVCLSAARAALIARVPHARGPRSGPASGAAGPPRHEPRWIMPPLGGPEASSCPRRTGRRR